MTTKTTANIHFDKGDVWHRWHPADDNCHAYGALKFGRTEEANVFFGNPEQIDAVIAELVALKQEMAPPVVAEEATWCPAETVLDDEETVYCDRDYGHPGSHHAPGPDEGSEVAWGDEPERCPEAYALGDKVFLCSLKPGHEGLHAELTSTGAFNAEWGYPDGHVHTTSGHQYPACVAS